MIHVFDMICDSAHNKDPIKNSLSEITRMYQDFSSPPENAGDPARIEAVRKRMMERELSGFLVPRADAHQGEYVPPCAERLFWLTGFSGSAGQAVILAEKAAIFIDGRYTLQVRDQVATEILEPVSITETNVADWLFKETKSGDRIGFDPWLHTIKEIKKLKKRLASNAVELVECENLVDLVWDDQPLPPKSAVVLHDLQFAGMEASEKILLLQEDLREKGADYFILTQPESIAWLFNIRGSDVPHTPLVLCFAIISRDEKPVLFMDPDKLDKNSQSYLAHYARLMKPEALLDFLATIDGKIGLDPSTANAVFLSKIQNNGQGIVEFEDPCFSRKAVKNKVELAGTRRAHIRDGVAVTRFLYWLSQQAVESLDEILAAKALEEFRKQQGKRDQQPLLDISFDTISGFGGNGAIVHYRVTEASNKPFSKDSLYLVDSGGQYRDGTTDITRTIAIGTPTNEMRHAFTLVLKGMISISRLRFPKATTGAQIDGIARQALWQAGLDYDHGTGHGVGSFLGVHEGPQRISKVSQVELKPGMILSNEPGYYQTGDFGIRIENLIVVEAASDIEGGNRPMMGFETLTFAPIDRRLIVKELLCEEERRWLNQYHEEVFNKLSAAMNDEEKQWLEAKTAPL